MPRRPDQKPSRAIALIASILAVIIVARTEAAQNVDVVIVAGQSNAVGFDAKPAEMPDSNADRHVHFWWRSGDPPPDKHDSYCGGKWRPLQAQPLGEPNRSGGIARQYGNFAQAEGGFGPEIGLARALHGSSKRPLAVFKVAFSGTALDRDWRVNDDGPNGACFRAFAQEWRLAKEQATKQGWRLRPRGFFWVQGESDANTSDAPRYADRLATLLNAVRETVDVSTLPCFIAVNTRFQEKKNRFMPVIVQQQMLAAARDPLCTYVDTSSASIANAAHYDSDGTLKVGRWFADALQRFEARREDKPLIRVVTLGDSITKGVRSGVSAKQTFAHLLEHNLQTAGENLEVVNVGIGGERTDQAIARLNKIIALAPDVVLIMYGTNDSYVDQGKTASRLSLDAYKANLHQLVSRLLEKGIRPVLMTEPKWAKGARRNGVGESPNERLAEYCQAARNVAAERRVPLVDHFADWSKAQSQGQALMDWTTDGCHPNATGHAQIARIVEPVLRNALPRPTQLRKKLIDGEPVRVVCFGDSVTGVYYHTGSRRAYADMVRLALERFQSEARVEVFNAGVSGNTTADALRRIQRDVLSHKPDLVTVMFGLNDVTRVGLDSYKNNLREIVIRCRNAGAQVVLATPNNVLTTPARPTEKLIQYCDAVRNLARELDTPLCDIYQQLDAVRRTDETNWRLLMSDPIHPNLDGHKFIASALVEAATGERIDLANEPPAKPWLVRSKERRNAGVKLRVIASEPISTLLESSAEDLGLAPVEANTWKVDGLSLSAIRDKAKSVIRKAKPDLVILRLPRNAYPEDMLQFADQHTWTCNWALNFGPPTWDVVVVHPDVFEPSEESESRDALIRRLVSAHDLPLIDRVAADSRKGEQIVEQWFHEQLAP